MRTETTPFGKYLRKLRIDKDIPSADMAEVFGFSNSHLSAIERGKNIADPLPLLTTIATHYRLTRSERLELEEAASTTFLQVKFDISPDVTPSIITLLIKLQSVKDINVIEDLIKLVDSYLKKAK
jgi:transcriptional regulator with XRE-family HTH domain